jgi:hypothetical protein
MAYIYKIANDINGKVYIGKTEMQNPQRRFTQHKNDRLRFSERPLYRAMNKYGVEHFSFEVLEETLNTNEREKYWIEHYNSYGSEGYNATRGGDGTEYFKHSDQEVVEKYEELRSVKETAEFFDADKLTISKRLHRMGVEVPRFYTENFTPHAIQVLYKGKMLFFESVTEAAKWVEKEKLSKTDVESIRRSISRAVNKTRKTYLKLSWDRVKEEIV